MARTVSATDAKVHLGALLQWASDHADDVIIESRGRPKAAIISFDQYRELLRLREQDARREALRQMEELAQRVGARNEDLSVEEAESLVHRATREAMEELVAEGRVPYDRD